MNDCGNHTPDQQNEITVAQLALEIIQSLHLSPIDMRIKTAALRVAAETLSQVVGMTQAAMVVDNYMKRT